MDKRMKKKTKVFFGKLSMFFILLGMCLLITGINIQGIKASDEDFTYEENEDGLVITSYIGNDTDVVVPSQIGGKSVIGIGNSAFSDKKDIKSIDLPDGLLSIEDNAFASCWGLTSLTIPESVTSVGWYSFYEIANVICNDTIEGLNYSNPYVINGYVEDGFTYYDNTKKVLLKCDTSTNGTVTIPETVTEIRGYAFYGCSGVTQIVISGNVDTISGTFEGCSNIRTAGPIGSGSDFEYGWTGKIPNRAFFGLKELTSIKISESVTEVSLSTFAYVGPNYNSCIIFLNKDCVIWDSGDSIPENARICGFEGSTAEQYAQKYYRNFTVISGSYTDPEIYVADARDITVVKKSDDYFGTNNYFRFSDIYLMKESKDRVYEIDGSSITFETAMKISGMQNPKGKIHFTVSEGKYANLTLYARAASYKKYSYMAVFREDDNSMVEDTFIGVYGADDGAIHLYNIEPGDYYISTIDTTELIPLLFYYIEVEETENYTQHNNVMPWDEVMSPSIIHIFSTPDSTLMVYYDMLIGNNGCDYVEVEMYDVEGNLLQTRYSAVTSRYVIFNPKESDEYIIKIKAKRYSGEEKEGLDNSYYFVYTLFKPEIYVVSNMGYGMVKVEYSEVHEATSYIVEYSTDLVNWEVGAVSKNTEAKIYGLEIGQTYYIQVKAKRGYEEVNSTGTATILVSEEPSVSWATNSCGLAKSKNDNFTSLSDTDFVMESKNNNGKITVKTADGYLHHYIKVKDTQDFTFTANVTVDSFIADGQQGCGIIVADTHGSRTGGWNNILYAGAQKISYKPTSESDSITQNNGIGVRIKSGLDKQEVEDVIENGMADEYGYTMTQYPLETRYPDKSNIVGNFVDSELDSSVNITNFDLCVKKVGKKYYVTYTSADKEFSNTLEFDIGDDLVQIEPGYIYVGCFTARNCKATFKNVNYTLDVNADYSKVDDLVKKAGKLDKNRFKDFSKVDEAIKAIVRGYNGKYQAAVDIMAKNINDAINGLELIPVETVEEDGTKVTVSSTEKISGGEIITKATVDGTNQESKETVVSIKSDTINDAPSAKITAKSELELINNILTDNEINEVNGGAHLSFDLKVNDIESEINQRELKSITKQLDRDDKIGSYLDISIEKTIGKKLVDVSELKDLINISIELPDYLVKTDVGTDRTFEIVRVHDGIAEKIEAIYDEKTGMLTFASDKFSTYAVVYKDEVCPHTDTEVKTEDSTCAKTGSEKTVCKACGKVVTEKEIAKKEHTVVTDPMVPATSTQSGLTEGSHCSVCGEVIKKQEVIPMLEEKPVPEDPKQEDPVPEDPVPDEPKPENPADSTEKVTEDGHKTDFIENAQGWTQAADGNTYWYEDGLRQGYDSENSEYRGKEIFDPETNAWYWLDNVQGGAIAKSKDVYQESDAGIWASSEDGTGKWVRYDANGLMIKGWCSGSGEDAKVISSSQEDKEKPVYYFDLTYGTMAKGYASVMDADGVYREYYFDELTGVLDRSHAPVEVKETGWATVDGKEVWYEGYNRQGYKAGSLTYRGKEIYDPETDAWYWLDNVQGGAKAVSKDVYQESLAGDWGDTTNEAGEKIGKWVRYDAEGHMVKGWSADHKYYFDPIFGTMAKGVAVIDGRTYNFDKITGELIR